MIVPVSGKRPKHKHFQLQTRYYDPEKERRENQRRIHFARTTSARKPNYLWVYVLFLTMAVWIITKL